MTTSQLEDHLDRARPRLMALAADLASNGDRTQPVPPDEVAAGLQSLASFANAIAAELRGETPLR